MTISMRAVITGFMFGGAALWFWVLTTTMSRLANRHQRFQLRAPVRYAIGSACVWALYALTEWLLRQFGGHAGALHLLGLYIASGLPVMTNWHFDPEAPTESWPGMGPERVTNKAIALCESAAIEGRISLDSVGEAAQALERQMALLAMLRHMKANENTAASVHELRRTIAKQLGQELAKEAQG